MISSFSEIVIGKKYKSKRFPGAVYLACVKPDRSTKFLVVVKCDEKEMFGHQVDTKWLSISYFKLY